MPKEFKEIVVMEDENFIDVDKIDERSCFTIFVYKEDKVVGMIAGIPEPHMYRIIIGYCKYVGLVFDTLKECVKFGLEEGYTFKLKE